MRKKVSLGSFLCFSQRLFVLLPTRSEEREVLGVGSIPVAKLPSHQYMKILYYDCTDMKTVG